MRNGGGEDPQPRRSGSCRPVLPVRASIAFRRGTTGQSGDLALDLGVCVAVDREVVQAGVLGAPVKSHCRHGRHAWQADHTVQLSATIGVLLDGRVTTTAA
jgi:hypothetical protein